MRDKILTILLSGVLGLSAWTLGEVLTIKEVQIMNTSILKYQQSAIEAHERKLEILMLEYYKNRDEKKN